MVTLFRHLGLPEHARAVAQLLQDYDPTLSLERLPAGHPWLDANPDKPYAVIHRNPAFPEYVIESYPESMLDHRIFANTVFGDANKHNWDLEEFDPVAVSAMLVGQRQREDQNEIGNDVMAFVRGGRKHY